MNFGLIFFSSWMSFSLSTWRSFSEIYLNVGASFSVLGKSEKLLLAVVLKIFEALSYFNSCGLKSALSDCSWSFPWVFSWFRLRWSSYCFKIRWVLPADSSSIPSFAGTFCSLNQLNGINGFDCFSVPCWLLELSMLKRRFILFYNLCLNWEFTNICVYFSKFTSNYWAGLSREASLSSSTCSALVMIFTI